MTTMKHTPAPWVAEGSTRDGDFAIYNEETYEEVLDIHTGDIKKNNLNLILAAPDLLEALIEMIELCPFIAPDITSNLIDNAHAAIAKATGESE